MLAEQRVEHGRHLSLAGLARGLRLAVGQVERALERAVGLALAALGLLGERPFELQRGLALSARQRLRALHHRQRRRSDVRGAALRRQADRLRRDGTLGDERAQALDVAALRQHTHAVHAQAAQRLQLLLGGDAETAQRKGVAKPAEVELHVQPDPQLADVDHETVIHDGDPQGTGKSECTGFRPAPRRLEPTGALSALECRLQAPRS